MLQAFSPRNRVRSAQGKLGVAHGSVAITKLLRQTLNASDIPMLKGQPCPVFIPAACCCSMQAHVHEAACLSTN